MSNAIWLPQRQPVPFALDVGTSGGLYIDSPGLDDLPAFTWLMWIYTDSSGTGAQTYLCKDNIFSGNRKALARVFGDVDDFDFQIERTGTWASATTVGVDKAVNAWTFVAVMFADGIGGPRIFTGDLGNPAIEASYTSRTNGTGSVSSDAGAGLSICAATNDSGSTHTESMLGQAGTFQCVSRLLTLNEIRYLQYNPVRVPGTELLYYLGESGQQAQVDRSGHQRTAAITNCFIFRKTGLTYGAESVPSFVPLPAAVGGPKGPLGHPLRGPLGGPI